MKRFDNRRGPGAQAMLGVGVATAMLLTGCGSSSSTSSSGSSGGGTADTSATMRVAYPVIQSLDPAKAPEPAELQIVLWPVYDRLIQVNGDSQYAPMLATSWAYSNSGKTLTLKLRSGVKFSDGTPFDAAAVKANLDWDKTSKGSALALAVSDIKTVSAVNASTVKVALVKPSTTVLSSLASFQGGAMISPKALNSPDLGTHPVGTGAYVISSFVPGASISYKRRTDKGGIWDSQTGKPATMTISTMAQDAEANAIKAGQIDVGTWSTTLQTYQSMISQGKLAYTAMQGVPHIVGVCFNPTSGPLSNVKVRQAANYAIDRAALDKAFAAPGNPVRVQPWPSNLPGFSTAREGQYQYDPAKAKQLLKEAGYPNGVDVGEMLVANTGAFPQVSQTVQANLAAVGIKIKLRTVDVFTIDTAWAKSKAAAMLQYMSIPSIDAYTWLQRLFLSPFWLPGGSDATMQKLSAGTDNPNLTDQQRAAQVSKAVQYATDQAYYLPLYQGVGGLIATSQVKGLSPMPNLEAGVADFRNAYMTH